MSYVYNKNHDRTHLHTCPAIKMMLEENMEVIKTPKGKNCGWCGAGVKEEDHALDDYIPEFVMEVA
ncbi:hypothetical protein [Methanobacterium formicicum]|uniref:hypothetical protein n=1 Tax=Methanobacterium formicicum TaxID=2162 RepID=UPI0024924EA1|nr:hypothetical protein [Methanobacterium formicicum]